MKNIQYDRKNGIPNANETSQISAEAILDAHDNNLSMHAVRYFT